VRPAEPSSPAITAAAEFSKGLHACRVPTGGIRHRDEVGGGFVDASSLTHGGRGIRVTPCLQALRVPLRRAGMRAPGVKRTLQPPPCFPGKDGSVSVNCFDGRRMGRAFIERLGSPAWGLRSRANRDFYAMRRVSDLRSIARSTHDAAPHKADLRALAIEYRLPMRRCGPRRGTR